jgi:hypothetical protein
MFSPDRQVKNRKRNGLDSHVDYLNIYRLSFLGRSSNRMMAIEYYAIWGD